MTVTPTMARAHDERHQGMAPVCLDWDLNLGFLSLETPPPLPGDETGGSGSGGDEGHHCGDNLELRAGTCRSIRWILSASPRLTLPFISDGNAVSSFSSMSRGQLGCSTAPSRTLGIGAKHRGRAPSKVSVI
jgi:hypothetical protein